jgi:hypothetical protein
MKSIFLAVAMLSALAGAQGGKTGLSKPHAAQVTASGYVTQADARVVFERAEKLLRNVTKTKAVVPAIPLKGTSPITRAQTIDQLNRLYEIVRPTVKVTPRPVLVRESAVKLAGPSRSTLLKLVRMGAVGNFAPLATGPDDKLTPKQFGDALGFFLARMAQMTHLPSRKFSPPLMDG